MGRTTRVKKRLLRLKKYKHNYLPFNFSNAVLNFPLHSFDTNTYFYPPSISITENKQLVSNNFSNSTTPRIQLLQRENNFVVSQYEIKINDLQNKLDSCEKLLQQYKSLEPNHTATVIKRLLETNQNKIKLAETIIENYNFEEPFETSLNTFTTFVNSLRDNDKIVQLQIITIQQLEQTIKQQSLELGEANTTSLNYKELNEVQALLLNEQKSELEIIKNKLSLLQQKLDNEIRIKNVVESNVEILNKENTVKETFLNKCNDNINILKTKNETCKNLLEENQQLLDLEKKRTKLVIKNIPDYNTEKTFEENFEKYTKFITSLSSNINLIKEQQTKSQHLENNSNIIISNYKNKLDELELKILEFEKNIQELNAKNTLILNEKLNLESLYNTKQQNYESLKSNNDTLNFINSEISKVVKNSNALNTKDKFVEYNNLFNFKSQNIAEVNKFIDNFFTSNKHFKKNNKLSFIDNFNKFVLLNNNYITNCENFINKYTNLSDKYVKQNEELKNTNEKYSVIVNNHTDLLSFLNTNITKTNSINEIKTNLLTLKQLGTDQEKKIQTIIQELKNSKLNYITVAQENEANKTKLEKIKQKFGEQKEQLITRGKKLTELNNVSALLKNKTKKVETLQNRLNEINKEYKKLQKVDNDHTNLLAFLETFRPINTTTQNSNSETTIDNLTLLKTGYDELIVSSTTLQSTLTAEKQRYTKLLDDYTALKEIIQKQYKINANTPVSDYSTIITEFNKQLSTINIDNKLLDQIISLTNVSKDNDIPSILQALVTELKTLTLNFTEKVNEIQLANNTLLNVLNANFRRDFSAMPLNDKIKFIVKFGIININMYNKLDEENKKLKKVNETLNENLSNSNYDLQTFNKIAKLVKTRTNDELLNILTIVLTNNANVIKEYEQQISANNKLLIDNHKVLDDVLKNKLIELKIQNESALLSDQLEKIIHYYTENNKILVEELGQIKFAVTNFKANEEKNLHTINELTQDKILIQNELNTCKEQTKRDEALIQSLSQEVNSVKALIINDNSKYTLADLVNALKNQNTDLITKTNNLGNQNNKYKAKIDETNNLLQECQKQREELRKINNDNLNTLKKLYKIITLEDAPKTFETKQVPTLLEEYISNINQINNYIADTLQLGDNTNIYEGLQNYFNKCNACLNKSKLYKELLNKIPIGITKLSLEKIPLDNNENKNELRRWNTFVENYNTLIDNCVFTFEQSKKRRLVSEQVVS